MEQITLEGVLSQMREALETNDLSTASSIIEALRPADQADIFSDLVQMTNKPPFYQK